MTALYAMGIVVMTFAGFLVLHVALLAIAQRQAAGWMTTASLVFALMVLGGPVIVWRALAASSGMIRIGSVAWLLALIVGYGELRSLLSRGYSLRILLDLLGHQGAAPMQRMKHVYGGGMGIEGMLAKRLGTLATLKLLAVRDGRVGPLTPLGARCAAATSGMRRFLRLETVG